jgi:hypothetical protein
MITNKNNFAKYIMLFLVLFSSIGISLVDYSPVLAGQEDAASISTQYIVKPIVDISKAEPADPMMNTLNPNSPKYNPKDIYGPEQTRFGPPGKRSADISQLDENIIDAPIPGDVTDHQYWGTTMDSGTITGLYAYQSISTTLTLPNNTTLYAPTMICPNYCSLELVTYYACDNFGDMYRKVAVYNHSTESFAWSAFTDATFCSKYIRNNAYSAELLKSGSYWWALIYNYNNNTWDSLYNYTSQSNIDSWDMWEEYNMAPNFPSLPSITSQSIEVLLNGTWTYISSSYGDEFNGITSATGYSKGWTAQYYNWYFGP